MATRDWTNSTSFLAGFGGTLTADDVLRMGRGFGHVSAGLTNSGTDIRGVDIYESNENSIGSSGQPLELVCNQTGTGYFRWGGGGTELWLSAAGVANVIYRVVCAPTRNGHMTIRAMDTEEVVCESGRLTIEGNADVAALYVFGGDCTVLAASGGASALGALYVMGGTCRCSRDLSGVIHVGEGARLIVEDVLVVPTELRQYGGEIDWRGGAIPIVLGYAGLFDRARATVPITFGGTSFRAGPRWRRRDARVALDTWSNAVAIGTGPSVSSAIPG